MQPDIEIEDQCCGDRLEEELLFEAEPLRQYIVSEAQ
jgi:hypothetical protein